ncbi:MAG: QueT transporter family protein [Acholeplasmataceae bacterium]|nr:QueT transporter family protein [Acholeplasmataceae bacterium]
MKHFTLNDLLRQTMIAAIYVVLVLLFQFMSFEKIQFRIAEVLLILVFFDKKSLIGLVIGTFLANWLWSPFGLIDAVIGSFATFAGVILMVAFGRIKVIALIFPALTNGIIIGLMIAYLNQLPFLPIAVWVFAGEAAVLYLIGLPVYSLLKRNRAFIELFETNKK